MLSLMKHLQGGMIEMKFDLKKKLMSAALAGTLAIGAGMGASSAYAAQADRESIAQVALLQSLAQGYSWSFP